MSLTFVVFLTVPILAPSLGQLILLVAPWRYIFVVFAVFAALVAAWGFLRLPETLHPEYRLTLTRNPRARTRPAGARQPHLDFLHARHDGDVRNHHGLRRHGGSRFSPRYFTAPSLMPSMFALCAIFMGMAAYLNSRIVERLGMRLHLAHRVAVVHRRHGAACPHRGAWASSKSGPSWCCSR